MLASAVPLLVMLLRFTNAEQLPLTSGMLSFTAAGPLLVRAGAAAGTLSAPVVEVLESAAAMHTPHILWLDKPGAAAGTQQYAQDWKSI